VRMLDEVLGHGTLTQEGETVRGRIEVPGQLLQLFAAAAAAAKTEVTAPAPPAPPPPSPPARGI
jgi:hypothetical protein